MNNASALVDLFEVYTASPTSIGTSLTELARRRHDKHPVLVATAADFVLFPGSGRPPETEGFRLTTRGFKELAGVSHLAPAVGSLLAMHELGGHPEVWQGQARRLFEATSAARAENSEALWRDVIRVDAYRGREAAIAAMIDNACARTIGYLDRVISGALEFDQHSFHENFMQSSTNPTVSFDTIMIATFFLVGMDIGHRVMKWLRIHQIDWSRAMVLITGKQGRPTAGVTIASNSVAAMIIAASGYKLPLDRLFIAPHAPSAPVNSADIEQMTTFENSMRQLWAYTRAISEVAGSMFPGLPSYSPAASHLPQITEGTVTLADMPKINGPGDWLAMRARLRLVMEDPRQLLSGCVTDYAVQQLHQAGNDPTRVTVPGLDGVSFPKLE